MTMFTRTHRATALSIAAVSGLLLLSCGGDDETASTPPSTPQECPSSYSVTFLPTPVFNVSSSAVSLNNQTPGQAVGEISGDAAGWSGGSFFSIVNAFGGFNSIALGNNDSGQIVGGAETTSANVFHAFLYSAGKMTDLGTLGGSGSFATAINNAGLIVGSSDTAGNAASHAFLRSAGGMIDLGTLGGANSRANAINSSGQIVGSSQLSGNSTSRAFLYDNGRMTDLGTLGGQNSSATGINEAGQVVGSSQTAGKTDDHAFLYSHGTMRELVPSTISAASGINAKGHVVGRMAAPTSPSGWHAFRFCGGTLTDLNSLLAAGSGVELLDASDINDNGEIVGVGSPAASSAQQAFLLTPQ